MHIDRLTEWDTQIIHTHTDPEPYPDSTQHTDLRHNVAQQEIHSHFHYLAIKVFFILSFSIVGISIWDAGLKTMMKEEE